MAVERMRTYARTAVRRGTNEKCGHACAYDSIGMCRNPACGRACALWPRLSRGAFQLAMRDQGASAAMPTRGASQPPECTVASLTCGNEREKNNHGRACAQMQHTMCSTEHAVSVTHESGHTFIGSLMCIHALLLIDLSILFVEHQWHPTGICNGSIVFVCRCLFVRNCTRPAHRGYMVQGCPIFLARWPDRDGDPTCTAPKPWCS